MTRPDLAAAIGAAITNSLAKGAARKHELDAQPFGGRYAQLDELVELSKANPTAFAELDADTRYMVAQRAAHLAHRAAQQQG